MPWDIALDAETGDWLFGPTRDLIGVTGPELDKQRIMVRTKIPRGSFIYDDDGTLGSFLYLIPRGSTESDISDARSYVHEALASMEGISITDIEVGYGETSGQLEIHVKFEVTGDVDTDAGQGFEDENDQPEFDARITYTEAA